HLDAITREELGGLSAALQPQSLVEADATHSVTAIPLWKRQTDPERGRPADRLLLGIGGQRSPDPDDVPRAPDQRGSRDPGQVETLPSRAEQEEASREQGKPTDQT